MNTGIVSYGAGNTRSLQFAFERLGMRAFVSDCPDQLAAADRLVLPGVGAAGPAMLRVREAGLDEMIRGYRRPLLGICLGMQLLCRSSEEGNVDCLNIFTPAVKRFQGLQKVPHTGWNTLVSHQGALFRNVEPESFVYFVHSYFAGLSGETAAQSVYMHSFTAALQRDNYFGVQFHPEKSGRAGEIILQNFLRL